MADTDLQARAREIAAGVTLDGDLAAYRADGNRWEVTAWRACDGDEIEVIVAEGWERSSAAALATAAAVAAVLAEGVS